MITRQIHIIPASRSKHGDVQNYEGRPEEGYHHIGYTIYAYAHPGQDPDDAEVGTFRSSVHLLAALKTYPGAPTLEERQIQALIMRKHSITIDLKKPAAPVTEGEWCSTLEWALTPDTEYLLEEAASWSGITDTSSGNLSSVLISPTMAVDEAGFQEEAHPVLKDCMNVALAAGADYVLFWI